MMAGLRLIRYELNSLRVSKILGTIFVLEGNFFLVHTLKVNIYVSLSGHFYWFAFEWEL